MNDPVSVLFANLPGSDTWDESLWGRLVEDGVWDEQAFWELHAALISLARINNGSALIDRATAQAVCKIQARVLGCVASHRDPDDVFKITNLSDERLGDFVERFEHAVLSVFSGEFLPESSYALRSPL
jgi:hypothetical protein